MNLRNRLNRIRDLDPKRFSRMNAQPPVAAGSGTEEDEPSANPAQTSAISASSSDGIPSSVFSVSSVVNSSPGEGGWTPVGHETLKRTVPAGNLILLPETFPPVLGIVAPDFSFLLGSEGRLSPEDLLFFDLETTGLGGAGTVAFLAAFGWFERAAPDSGEPGRGEIPFNLRVTQYLLLDYPGEGDFLEAVLAEIGGEAAGPEAGPGALPFLVTYNGKTFDTQILKTRCLLNGIRPPAFRHADLLHPCRRLWKRVLPGCGQAEIETAVLGLDRTGDIPGALAPEIWFSFLKTGDLSALTGIADHNVKDIAGLARIAAALSEIAAAPLAAGEKYRYDLENLALHWRKVVRRLPVPDAAGLVSISEGLLEAAAGKGCPRAAYTLAGDLFCQGRHDEGRRWLDTLFRLPQPGAFGDARVSAPADGPAMPRRIDPGEGGSALRALACRLLAIDAEHRRGDPSGALAHVDAALIYAEEGGIRPSLVKDLERRRERLLKKTGLVETPPARPPGSP